MVFCECCALLQRCGSGPYFFTRLGERTGTGRACGAGLAGSVHPGSPCVGQPRWLIYHICHRTQARQAGLDERQLRDLGCDLQDGNLEDTS